MFEGITETIERNTLLMAGPIALMERILHGVREGQEKMEMDALFNYECSPLTVENLRGRAGSTGKKYNDKWQSTTFGESILELLGVERGTHNEGTIGHDGSDVRSFFLNKTQQVFGIGKLNDLLSGIAEGTRAGYVSAWKHWFQFTRRPPESRWITEIGPRWDETVINWILFETRIMGLQASTMGTKISGLRYWHLLSVFPDWGKWSGRYKQVLNNVAEKDVARRNYPFNLELTNWIYSDFGSPIGLDSFGGGTDNSVKFELCAAMTIGFFFLLRVSELENLRMRDIRISTENNQSFLTLFLEGSKTDRYNQGDFKRLGQVGGLLCPLDALVRYVSVIEWDPTSTRKLFGNGLRGRLGGMMKTAASANHVDPSRIGTHSLRSGGANAMFVAGYDAEIIKRWGRWKSDTLSFYLWNDDRVLTTVGKGMLRSEGLLSQLQRQSDRDMIKEKEGREGRAGGRGGQWKGQKSEPAMEEEPQLAGRNVSWSDWNRGVPQMYGRQRRHRAGGKGEKCEWSMHDRMTAISKKISTICRHSNEFYRQKDGFIAWGEIEAFFNRRGVIISK